MRESKPSSSAQSVALVRAHLHASGVIDDPWVHQLLTPRRQVMARVLRARPFTKYGETATFSFLAARTHFFDAAVTNAITAGITQVAIIGAGYDTRAWRLAAPGVLVARSTCRPRKSPRRELHGSRWRIRVARIRRDRERTPRDMENLG